MVPALVVCHGSLGQAFLQALECIFGPVEKLTVLSNEGLSAGSLQQSLEQRLEDIGSEALVFTDYFGGSCATACMAGLSDRSGLRLVSGVNLPMLIYYLTHREEMDLQALLPGLLQRGRDAVRELMPPSG